MHTDIERYVCIYLYIQRYMSKIPIEFSEILKMPVHFSTGKGWALRTGEVSAQASSSAFGNSPLRVLTLRAGKLWEASQKDVIAGYSALWPKIPCGPVLCASVKITAYKVVRWLALVLTQSLPWLQSKSKILLRSQITVPFRLSFRHK